MPQFMPMMTSRISYRKNWTTRIRISFFMQHHLSFRGCDDCALQTDFGVVAGEKCKAFQSRFA